MNAARLLTCGIVLVWLGLVNTCPAAEVNNEDQIWQNLMQDDEAGAKYAYQLGRTWKQTPRYAVDFLRSRIKPKELVVPQRTAQLIRDLDSDDFNTREAALKELMKLGMAAQPALIQALANKPSLEVTNRINQLLSKLDVPLSREVVRVLRCGAILHEIDTPEARELLKELAAGASGVPLSPEDQKELLRMAGDK